MDNKELTSRSTTMGFRDRESDKTIEAPAFSALAKTKTDVERNIDEAERYMDLMTLRERHEAETLEKPVIKEEYRSTEEISLFDPKDIPMQELPEEKGTSVFDKYDIRKEKAEQPDDLPTQHYGAYDDGKTIEAKRFVGAEDDEESASDATIDVRVLKEAEKGKKEKEKTQKKKEAAYDGFEYTDIGQKQTVIAEMRSKSIVYRVRIGVAVVLSLMLFALENITPVKALLPSQTAYIVVDWLLAFICAILIFDRLGAALKDLLHLKFDYDSITLFSLLFSLAATACALLLESESTSVSLYNFSFSVCVLLNTVALYYNLRRDQYSFSVLSSRYRKRAVELHHTDDEIMPETVEFANCLSDEGAKCGIVKKVDFIEDYFAHRSQKMKAKYALGLLIPFCFLIAVGVFCGAHLVMAHDVAESFGVAYACFMMCMPCSAFLSYTYPLYLTSKKAHAKHSAILCDKTSENYQNTMLMTFRDSDAFQSGSAKVRGIKLFGNKKIDHAIYYAAAVYAVVGGPLKEVFGKAALHPANPEQVKIRETESDGISAIVDGRNIVIGTPDYMDRQCFTTVFEKGDEDYKGPSDKRIFYLACDEVIIAKFYVQYTLHTEFSDIIRYFSEAGINISIRTADPCLDDGVIYGAQKRKKKIAVKVVKGCLPEPEEASISAKKAGIISYGSVKELAATMLLCKKLESVKRVNLILKIVSAILGVVVMTLVLFSGKAPDMISVFPVLYQLFWLLPVWFVSRIYI